MAINCLGNLCMRTGNKLNGKYKDIYEIFLANLNSMTIDDTASLKVSIWDIHCNENAEQANV